MVLPEMYRAEHPFIQKITGDITGGYFVFPHYSLPGYIVCCVAWNDVWQRVCVTARKDGHRSKRCPSWQTMCFVKEMFWDKEETIIQYHPAESERINNHPYALWLWRHRDYEIATPPSYLIGVKQ